LFRSKPIFKSMESISVGTAQLNLSPVQTQEICLVIPSSLILGQISKSINPLIKKLIVNNIQIESLSKTRDTLLPKLMSGQVRVNNIKQTANA
jgi:type I restriction enzyme S subunit